MFARDNDQKIQDAIKGMLGALGQRELPASRTDEFIHRLYTMPEASAGIDYYAAMRMAAAVMAVAVVMVAAVLGYRNIFLPGSSATNEKAEKEALYSARIDGSILLETNKLRTRELLNAAPLYADKGIGAMFGSSMVSPPSAFGPAAPGQSSMPIFIGAYYERMGEHEKAVKAFQYVVDKYPRSALGSVAQCAIGIIYEEKIHDPVKAKAAYERVISEYPHSPEIDEALAGLRRIGSSGSVK
ncbi:MAG: tetratricopeptide repeat protein [Candidatus Omnitrophica bacterium]|nr:tetratricopeptide repeat protein [Candidatus Omnitrophota bacterium]